MHPVVYFPIDTVGAELPNPFVSELIDSLENSGCIVKTGLFRLNSRGHNFDIVNFQWPESLFNGLPPNNTELDWLDQKLAEINRECKIVTTVHNLQPHYQTAPEYRILYQKIYRHTNAFVHMGKKSIELIEEHYPEETANKIHVVIPHGDYRVFGAAQPKDLARQELGIPKNAGVALVVGSIRDDEEYRLLADSLKYWTSQDRVLLFAATFRGSRRIKKVSQVPGAFCSYLRNKIRIARLELNRNVFLIDSPVPNSKMATAVSASDLVLIPRLDILNSGNVALGYTYGRPVVGPACGNVGEILKDTGNFLFNPDDGSKGVGRALSAAFEASNLDSIGIGNKRFADNTMAWEEIASSYCSLYERLLNT